MPHLELKTAVGVGSYFSAGERVISTERAVTTPVQDAWLCTWEDNRRGAALWDLGEFRSVGPVSLKGSLGSWVPWAAQTKHQNPILALQ